MQYPTLMGGMDAIRKIKEKCFNKEMVHPVQALDRLYHLRIP